MPGLPDLVQSKVMILLDQEQQALTVMNMTQRAIGENQKAYGNNPQGDKAKALGREIARLQGLMPDLQAKHRLYADLNTRVSRYLELLPAHVNLVEAKPVKAKLGEGETHLKVVTRMRSEIIALIGERSRAERASPTVNEMKAAAAKYIEKLGSDGTPRIVMEHGKQFDLHFSLGTLSSPEPSPAQVLAYVDPKAFLKRLHEQIDEAPKPANMMTFADRKKRLAEISDELFELERTEQAHIEAAFGEGTLIEQRPNVDVRALLGLVVVKDKIAA